MFWDGKKLMLTPTDSKSLKDNLGTIVSKCEEKSLQIELACIFYIYISAAAATALCLESHASNPWYFDLKYETFKGCITKCNALCNALH